jgi:hypothetical protein
MASAPAVVLSDARFNFERAMLVRESRAGTKKAGSGCQLWFVVAG